MLYIIYKGDNAALSYGGGQTPIVHIEADLDSVIEWADRNQIKWAYTNTNASAAYAEFYNKSAELSKINWRAIEAQTWSDCKDEKQAEFLFFGEFPLDIISRIGVINGEMVERVSKLIECSTIPVEVCMKSEWYY